MAASATTVRNLLEAAWNLTGELSKNAIPNTATPPARNDMSYPVRFFDRYEVKGNEQVKSVAVSKINNEGNETVVRHPNFNEVMDTYEIIVSYRVKSVIGANYTTAVNNIQLMAAEVVRILLITYNPSTNTGTYFKTTNNWIRQDMLGPNQPTLQRKLLFTLTKITSSLDKVFLGFGGVLVFDTSASAGDDKPTSDATYLAVKNVELEEGWTQIPKLTKDTTNGKGVPFYRRGLFSGRFNAIMYAHKDEFTGGKLDQLDKIYVTQTNTPLINQQAKVVFLHSNKDTESPTPSVLTTSSTMKIDRLKKISPDEDLLLYTVSGTLIKPTVYSGA